MTTFYVGSYDKKRGIYICNLDDKTGKMTLVKKVETSDYAAYLIRDEQYLYVSYKNASKKENGGGMGSFLIQNDDLIELSHSTSNGRSYTHLCLDPNKNYLYGANYHAGTTVAYRIENHEVKEKTCVVYHKGMGPDLFGRQASPHPHYVGITPEKKYLYTVDLGSDRIVTYKYGNGKLVEDKEASINILPGSGPRHLIFTKDGKHGYLVNEIASTIMVFNCGEKGMVLSQKISCLPFGYKKDSSAAAIRLSEDEKYLFVSNRGHNSIAMYLIMKETGKIGLIGFYEIGKNPRDINVIGNYVISAAQDKDELECFRIGQDELIRLNEKLKIPAPVCVCK